jgi:hypothetical protein
LACDKPNFEPVLSDISAPDSLAKGDTLAYLVSIRAFDPNGNDDVDSVYFEVTRPDGSLNPNRFVLHDDGLAGDAARGDYIYSTGIQAPSPSNQTGDYTFTFHAVDKHGKRSSNNPSVYHWFHYNWHWHWRHP